MSEALTDFIHDAVESSSLTDRELLVGTFDALRSINGTLQATVAEVDKIKFWEKMMWAVVGLEGGAIVAMLSILAGHAS